jgi:hypothetical protein
MCIEDLRPIRAIEAFDVRILIRLPGLDVVHGDAVLRAPIDQRLRRKLGTIVPSREEVRASQVLL